jgi:hypothetical protein
MGGYAGAAGGGIDAPRLTTLRDGNGGVGNRGVARLARPAASSLMGPPPVPLFNAHTSLNGMLTAVNSPVPPVGLMI